MGVTVKRAEPIKVPPIKEIIVEGPTTRRGFRVKKLGTKFKLTGTLRGQVPMNEAWSVSLSKEEAKQFIADLAELVGD